MPMSRRSILKAVGAGVLGTAYAALFPHFAQARTSELPSQIPWYRIPGHRISDEFNSDGLSTLHSPAQTDGGERISNTATHYYHDGRRVVASGI